MHLAGIDVDFTHVVDDHCHPQVLAVAQDMVEQGAFAGTQKAGKHGDGKAVGHGQILIGAGAFERCIAQCYIITIQSRQVALSELDRRPLEGRQK
ncbi:hypothetical protein D9M71_374790 [compost metagenome]